MNGLSGLRRRAPESFSYDIPKEDVDTDFRIDESLEDERHVLGTSSTPHNALQNITTPGVDVMEVFGPVDNLSSNKDQTMFVAAGSFGVIKIFRMADRFHMHQVADLRALKKKNLAYTASAVVWSKVAENLIATVSTNGTVVLWDPTVPAVLQETRGHNRSATSVDFHRSNPFLLISSFKDALIMHDTRTIEVPRRFKINDTIRDVSFCLHQPHHDFFVAADETGAVKFWDMRKEDKPYITFQPHHGLASSVALHPTNPSLIASGGGRDKLIKVWDWRLPKNWERKNFKTTYQVETIAPVSRVYWRPDKEHEIASCAVVSDTSVAVWDVRRPFLPVTSYRGHRDSATDIWWNHNDPSYFVSAGKDGFIRLHRIEEGEHTVDHLCDCTMDIAPDGMMAVAVSTQIGMKQMAKNPPERKKGANLQFTQRPGFQNLRGATDHPISPGGRRIRTVHFDYDPFKDLVPSVIATGIPSSVLKTAQPKDFARLSSDYLIGGKSCQELCEWNARVAAGYGFPDKAESWRVIGALVERAGLEEAYQEENDREEERKNIMREKYRDMLTTDEIVLMLRNAPVPQPKNSEHTLLNINKHLEWNPIIFSSLPFEQSTIEESICPPEYVENSDFYFGPGELRGTAFGLRNEEPPCDDFLGLEQEAFTLRPCVNSSKYTDLVNSKTGINEFNPLKKIKSILMRYAEQGDVQMCTVAAAIIGHYLSKEISFLKIELWARSYFDMLERLELHVACAQLVKFAWMKGIKERGHQSTFLPVHYQHLHPVQENTASNTILVGNKRRKHCKGHIEKGRCSKCRDPVLPICVACDRPIIGLLWSCVKCSHSMHVQHALHHFKNQTEPDSEDESIEDKLLMKARQMAKVIKKCPVPWCRCTCNVRIRSVDDAVIPSKMASIQLVSEAIQKMKESPRTQFLLNTSSNEEHDENDRFLEVPAGQELFLDINRLKLSSEDNELLDSIENRCQVAEEMDDPYKEQIRSLANLVYALYATKQSKVDGCAEYLRSIRDSTIEAKCSIYQEIVDITDPRYTAMDRIADYNETCVIDEDSEVGKFSDDDRSSMASECDPEPGISLSPSGREEDIRDSITSVTITSGGPSSSNTELIDEEPIVSDHAYMPRRAVASEEMINDPAFKFMYGEEYQVALNAILRPTKQTESLTPLELTDRDVVIQALEGPSEEESEQLESFNRFHKRMMDKQSRATSIRIERLLDPILAAKPLQRPVPPQRVPFVQEKDDGEEKGKTDERRSPILKQTGPIPFYPVTSAPDTLCETKIVNDCGRVRICLPAIPNKKSEEVDDDTWWSWGSTEEDHVIAKNLETVVKEVNREMFDMEMEVTHHDPVCTKLPTGLSARPTFLTEVETTEQSSAKLRFFENLETSVESDPITLLLQEGHQVRNTPDRNTPRYY